MRYQETPNNEFIIGDLRSQESNNVNSIVIQYKGEQETITDQFPINTSLPFDEIYDQSVCDHGGEVRLDWMTLSTL